MAFKVYGVGKGGTSTGSESAYTLVGKECPFSNHFFTLTVVSSGGIGPAKTIDNDFGHYPILFCSRTGRLQREIVT